jgi:putative transposase
VKQNYQPDGELLRILEVFRSMVNACLRIGIETGTTSLKSLSPKAYGKLSSYNVPSYYKLCAISKTVGILKNYRKAVKKNPRTRIPYARRLMLTTCYGFKVEDGVLKLPLGERRYAKIPLNNHAKEVLSNPSLTVRSASLTVDSVSICYSKEIAEVNPAGYLGIDRNLDNVTTVDPTGDVQRHNLSEATETKRKYRNVKSHFKRSDARVRALLYCKYGVKERNRVQQILHQASKTIVQEAKEKQFGIAMEKLTGIRRLYRCGNGQGSNYRFRLNSWSYAELQRQIEYKARWEGLLIIYVNPSGTSAKCSVCGSSMGRIPEENRQLKCCRCGFTVDRDVNAARNILARALRFRAVGPAIEAMVQEPAAAVILKVDASQLTSTRPPTS